MVDVPLLIADRDTPATGDATFVRANPITGEPASRAASATIADANAAADAAAAAFPEWSSIGPSERRARLLRAADLLDDRADRFAELMTAEMGMTGPWAHFNCMLAAGILREAASMTTQVGGEVIPSDLPGSLAVAIRQPAGVSLGIAPWNAPVILGTRAIAMPLACGNTTILKASEQCPATHREIGAVMAEAGLGAGVVNVVTNAPADAADIVGALIAHPAVRRVNFTGSTKVGRMIAVTAAQHLKPVLLELGGKAPLLVLEDADVDAAVNAAIFGAFANMGQVCMSTERLIVHESVADEFAGKLAGRAGSLPAGDPGAGPVVLGSLIDQGAVDRVQRLVQGAVDDGATVLAGGDADGTIMKATVVDGVTTDMDIWTEESFGPSVSITRFADESEAIRLANDTEYGLSASVFTQDVTRGLAIARQIQSGICHVNGPTVHDEAQMPFGGVKGSGIGRFGGRSAIDEFTDLRWVTVQTGARHYPF